MTPTLTLIVPTAGRPSLARTLASVADQLLPGDAVLVAGDTTDGPLPETQAICRDYGARYLAVPGERHDWGHTQINAALAIAAGDYVAVNDDDDVWTPGALDAMRAAATDTPGRPLLFRFKSHWDMVFWDTRGVVAEGRIGGHCLVTPNLPGLVGRWTSRYEGDYDWIVDTLARWAPVEPAWVDRIIAEARPR